MSRSHNHGGIITLIDMKKHLKNIVIESKKTYSENEGHGNDKTRVRIEEDGHNCDDHRYEFLRMYKY